MKLANQKCLPALLAAATVVMGCNATLPANSSHPQAPTRMTSQDLLYVVQYQSTVDILSYPGGQLVEQITDQGDARQLCADQNGNVFIPDYAAEDILEYAHGGTTPIATFLDNGYHPQGCSVDPVSGRLAVASPIADATLTAGDVAIFKPGREKPIKRFTNPRMYEPNGCAYDDAGNLYIFGYGYSNVTYGLLPPGGYYIKQLHLKPAVSDPGQMQWDGKYLAVLDQYYGTLVRYSLNHNVGTKVGQTNLKTAGHVGDFWIQGSDVVAPEYRTLDIGIWKYPKGGKPIGQISTAEYAGSIVISPASSF